MKKPLIVANWKRYIEETSTAVAAAKAVARGASVTRADIVICPPALFIDPVSKVLAGKAVALGAQTVSSTVGPAHTGELSASMLAHMGVAYVIVGHSERRALGETDVSIRAAIEAAVSKKLTVILCIGESSRDSSGEHYDVLTAQLRGALPKLAPADAKRLVVAYEPVWAIGKSAADAMETHALEETVIYIRKVLAELVGRTTALSTPILYGGSVEVENAARLMDAGIAGFLVGHASVEPKSLLAIANAARDETPKR